MKVKKIVDCYADWCIPCQRFAQVFENASKNDKFNDIIFEKCNVEDVDEEFSLKYKIKSIPTILFLDENDDLIAKIMGGMTEDKFINAIENINSNES